MKIKIPSWLHASPAVKQIAKATRKRLKGKQWGTGYMHRSRQNWAGEHIDTFCLMGGIWYADADRCPNGRADWQGYDLYEFSEDEKAFVFLTALAAGWDPEKTVAYIDFDPADPQFEREMLMNAESHVTSWNDSLSESGYQKSKDKVMSRLRRAEKLVDECLPAS